METQKGWSIICALLAPPHAPFIPRRPRSKRVISCRRRLTFDDKAPNPKRKMIPFDVDATKVAKKCKRIKLEAECESSKESREDHIFQTRKKVLILGMARSEVKGDKKTMKTWLPLLDKEVGSSSKQKRISGRNEKDDLSLWNQRKGRLIQEEQCLNKLEPQTPLPVKEKQPSSRKGSVAIKTNQSKYRSENNSQLVEKMVSEAWYYTRSLNKVLLDQIESLECQDASNQPCNPTNQCRSSSGQLKVHGIQVSLKGQKKGSKKHRRSQDPNDVLRGWRKLLRKSDAKSPGEKLDEDNEPQCLHTRGLSFVQKVGSIQGSKEYLPWKGSVLDSVIGAFLTQRVSDNLSSSAFMSLGASFPQDRDCGEYGRHHRILREKRPNASRSPQKPSFRLVSKCPETLGDGANLEKHTRMPFNEKNGQETPRKGKVPRRGNLIHDWSSLRTKYSREEESETRSIDAIDYIDWDAVSRADVVAISKAISSRGMNIKLAKRIKDFLSRILADHRNLDLEWMRNVPPQMAKEFLLSVMGLGLKSEECLRLLTLRQPAFPVDINVARVTLRLGWVPDPPIGDKRLMSLLQEQSKVHDLMHEYLWPRLCKLDQETLYQLHYQMITFGKVFCTNEEPRCDECPMRTECKYYSNIIKRKQSEQSDKERSSCVDKTRQRSRARCQSKKWKPSDIEMDIEEFGSVDQHGNEKTLAEEFTLARLKLRSQRNQCLVKDADSFCPTDSVEAPKTPAKYHPPLKLRPPKKSDKKTASKKGRIPARSGSRTKHSVYELPDWHPILESFDDRDPDDSTPYLLVTWESGQLARQIPGEPLVKDASSLSPSCVKRSTTVPGTIMIPYRTALRGNFPLNGTYFQRNEVFADHKTSETPIDVRCKTLDQLPRKSLYCGANLSGIVKGLSADEIKSLFREGYICTRGFDCETSTPKALEGRLHTSSQGKRKQKIQLWA